MSVDRETAEQVRLALRKCLEDLASCSAPSGIVAHIEMALGRLEQYVAVLDTWEGDSKNR